MKWRKRVSEWLDQEIVLTLAFEVVRYRGIVIGVRNISITMRRL